ncbi:dopamine receptor D2b [Pimephales promelas]|uniref:dopamine receptor D2b n=1 Tax=Pimephales promelas TaxID=90988 RepID=UPI0019555DFE|nr:dopamine receptor D2b [Pimephales promelas]KAG1957393.1 D(2) dopamine receptor [Pimephales promelas]KAG1957394.1 D(2) dopamine receptor [Pimephales promelas]
MDFLTEYPYNDTYYDNGTGALNSTSCEAKHQYNYYAMLLTLLIFLIVFGNVLVCMAVSREKALQTTTNYLIVSLAVADLLVATLVMPWVVYLEVVGEWRFSKIHCDIFVTLDVMMCTASILNLCAISIDRYTAVAMPMLYNTRYSSKRRVTVMISVVWVLSFAISCPLLFGLNNTATRDGAVCEIANPSFVVYSSIMSFYVPFIITLLVYVQIYVVLRKRRKRVNTKRSCQKTDPDAQPSLKEKCTHPEDVKLCTFIIKTNGGLPAKNKKAKLIKEVLHQGCDVGVDIVAGTSPLEKKKQASTLVVDLLANPSPIHASPSHDECQSNGDEKNGHAKEVQTPKEAKPVLTQVLPNGKTQTTVTKTMSKRKIYQHKEKKATQMLAIVLGVFIICWLPFFITHILKTHCTSCVVPLEMYNAFTWLGYVNSAVNPIIYTTFNVEFRKAFIKILHC